MIIEYTTSVFDRVKLFMSKYKIPIAIISVTTLVIIAIIIGITVGATNNNSPNPHKPPNSTPPSPVPIPIPVPVPDPDHIHINGLSGNWFIRTGSTYMTRDVDNYLELAPLFNPSEQGWFINETLPGVYTIQNIHNQLYMTGFAVKPAIDDQDDVSKRTHTDEEIPHILVELHPLRENFLNTQYWVIDSTRPFNASTDSVEDLSNFGIKLWSTDSYIGVYEHRGNIMFGEEFHKWNITEYDDVLPDHHDPSKDDPTVDEKPKGWVMWYRNLIWKIQHKHLGKMLFAKPDNTVGLLDDYNVAEQIWNVTQAEIRPDFKFELGGTGLFLTETDDQQVTVEPSKETDYFRQRWWLRSSSVNRIHGIQNVRTGRFIYIDDTDGWTLTTEQLHPGWNSWKFIEADPTIIPESGEEGSTIPTQ